MTNKSIPAKELAGKIGDKIKEAKEEKPKKPVHMKHWQSEQDAIIRMSAVKSAAQIGKTADEVIEIATRFTEWIKTGC